MKSGSITISQEKPVGSAPKKRAIVDLDELAGRLEGKKKAALQEFLAAVELGDKDLREGRTITLRSEEELRNFVRGVGNEVRNSLKK